MFSSVWRSAIGCYLRQRIKHIFVTVELRSFTIQKKYFAEHFRIMKPSDACLLFVTAALFLIVGVSGGDEDLLQDIAPSKGKCLDHYAVCKKNSDCCTDFICYNDQCLRPCESGPQCRNDSGCCSNAICFYGTCQTVCEISGYECNMTKLCCSGACVKGLCDFQDCKKVGENCHPVTAPCCLFSICTNRKCVDTCVNRKCDTDDQCCPKQYCSPNKKCSTCLSIGQKCDRTTECCDPYTNQICSSSKMCTKCTTFGLKCKSHAECCHAPDLMGIIDTKSCIKGVCRIPCFPLGTQCSYDIQCCSGTCDSNVCKVACLDVSEKCTCSSQCCSGYCGERNMCEYKKPCGELGAPCSWYKDCCLANCPNGKCKVPCGSNNSKCSSDYECCGTGYCKNGVCMTGPCVTVGSACGENDDCCSKICIDFVCQPPCLAEGQKCSNDQQCCNLQCVKGLCHAQCLVSSLLCNSTSECCDTLQCTGATRCMFQCSPENGQCSTPEDCCYTNNCVSGKCGKDCYPSSYVCASNSDCCSNNCKKGNCV